MKFELPKKKRIYSPSKRGLFVLFLVAFFLLAEIGLIFLLAQFLRNKGGFFIYLGFQIFGLFITLFTLQRNRNPGYTLSWTIIILAVPILGPLFFLLWGRQSKFRGIRRRTRSIQTRMKSDLPEPQKALAALLDDKSETIPEICKRKLHFLAYEGFIAYRDTRCLYFPSGEEQFSQMFQDISEAQHYIFLQYFILAEGELMDRLESLLIQKAREGVEIRLMFDDFGSAITAPTDLIRRLKANGVQVKSFNPILRFSARLYINYRNHQKICVVDGRYAYLGGTNLADEYANIHVRFGHWKDTAVRLEGKACQSCTAMYLIFWDNDMRSEFLRLPKSYQPYLGLHSPAAIPENLENHGIFVPYWDGPGNNPRNPAEDLYLALISGAQKKLYVSTPYFVVDKSMLREFRRAAESGVDVRLITPGIPDKKYVYHVTRSYYRELLEAGIRIYEYTPGFIHAKMLLADDLEAVVGSINFDYRSLNLHFENAVYICNDPVIMNISEDFDRTLAECREFKMEDWNNIPLYIRLIQSVLQLFAPML